VNCACGGLPAQDVYAISTDGLRFYVTQTVPGQWRWKIVGLSAGPYVVYTTGRVERVASGTYSDNPRFMSGYTTAVACGLLASCTDHSPVIVNVRSRAETTGVDTFDWYSTDFPLIPIAGPPPPFVNDPPTTFPSAVTAAAYAGALATAARQVHSPSQCPVNLACFWLTSSHAGSGAAYYVAEAGANGDYMSCGLYLIGSGSAWQLFASICRASAAFPAVGASGRVQLGMGESGCVNVHSSPSLSARVVACLTAGTSVTVDDGPDYLMTSSQDLSTQYWWHLAGLGWMVHTYLGRG
jgi:hypothetical protein